MTLLYNVFAVTTGLPKLVVY